MPLFLGKSMFEFREQFPIHFPKQGMSPTGLFHTTDQAAKRPVGEVRRNYGRRQFDRNIRGL
jgi:hypothetical protein